MPKEELKRLTVDIPLELHRRAKVYAAQEGKELRSVVEAALRLWLSKAEGVRLSFGQANQERTDRIASRHPRARNPKKGGKS